MASNVAAKIQKNTSRPALKKPALPDIDLDTPPAETRIVVAMSGGVDSSVTAALLHEAGYEVIGITLQLYDHGEAIGRKGSCCAGQDIHDARMVADRLGIPHYVLNYENRFKQGVMDDFADAYLAGETPIPCVRCNQTVKFRDLLATARELGADALATGHYVRRQRSGSEVRLHSGVDGSKDQSYFLFATTPEQLAFLRFPLGSMHKHEARAHAERFGLAVSDKPDSQDICFVPTGGYARVVEKLRPGACDAGEIVHVNGTVLGEHNGIIHYTVGQRRGLGVAWPHPLYVVRLEPATRRVVVGPKEALETARFQIREASWLVDMARYTRPVTIKWRSMQTPKQAWITPLGQGRALVEPLEPECAIAPGQACVAYDGSQLLGGGWITREDTGAARASA